MKHYGKFLSWAGSPIKYLSNDIELLYLRKVELEKKLSALNNEINIKEREFSELIQNDWDEEEIAKAKEKANEEEF